MVDLTFDVNEAKRVAQKAARHANKVMAKLKARLKIKLVDGRFAVFMDGEVIASFDTQEEADRFISVYA